MDMEGKRSPRTDESCSGSEVLNNMNDFTLLYTNADCLTNKRSDLATLIHSLPSKPSVIAVTEVNSKSNFNKMQESEFCLDGYTIFGNNIGIVHTRGVTIYVDKNIQASQIEIPFIFNEYLLIQLRMRDSRKVLTIGNFYRSPNSTLENDC